MTITVLLDPAQMPDQSQDQLDFDNKMSGFMRDLPTLATQINESTAVLNALSAGGAYALPYIFDTATADADPGAGKLRLSSATQSASTVMRLDLTAGGQDYTTLIDTMDGSTSTIKGSIRLVKQGDLTKWMTFDVTARAAPSGYRNLTVACTDSSTASPFVAGDALMLFFQRNGDRGQPGANGVLVLASATVTTAVANIDFLNIFSADYDKYTIEISGVLGNSGGGLLSCQLAYGGAVVATGTYLTPASSDTNPGPASSASLFSLSSSQSVSFTVDIRGVNSGTLKGIGVRGVYRSGSDTWISVAKEGGHIQSGAASGFRLSGAIAAGTVRVFGHRNQ